MAEAQKSSLTSCALGSFVLSVAGSEYVCTSVVYRMAINQIPDVTVTVGCGLPIKATSASSYQAPEKLLGILQDKRTSAYLSMTACSLFEVVDFAGPPRRKLVFKGVIANGQVVYKAGTPTSRMVQFTCMSNAVHLYTKPLASYSYVCGAKLKADYADVYGSKNSGGVGPNDDLSSDRMSVSTLLQMAGDVKGNIASRLDAIIGAIIATSSVQASGASSSMAGMVSKYIFSTTNISTKNIGALCSDEFN